MWSNNYPKQASQVPEVQANRPMAYVINRPTSNLKITATLHVLNQNKEPQKCRTLVYTFSTTNFMSERLASLLSLLKHKYAVPIGVIDSLNTTSKQMITATIRPTDGHFERRL